MKIHISLPFIITMFIMIPVMPVCQIPDIKLSEKTGKQSSYAPESESLLYGQLNYPSGEAAVSSQDFADYPDYSCQAADDFIVPEGENWSVEQIFISGEFAPDGGPAELAHLIIYQNMTQSPGSIHLEFVDFAVAATVEGDLTFNFTTPFVLEPGHYWISVQPHIPYIPNKQWFWKKQETPTIENEFCWRNPGGGFGLPYTDWTTANIVLEGTVDHNLTFGIYGTVEPVSIICQEIGLRAGVQFISTYVNPEDVNFKNIMNPVLSCLKYAKNSAGGQLIKIGPNWVNGIGNWNPDEGYIAAMNCPATLTICGQPPAIPSNTPISINQKKVVPYLHQLPMDASTAFATILPELKNVKNPAGKPLIKIGPHLINHIGNCNPGEGYLVTVNEPSTLIYPEETRAMSFHNSTGKNQECVHFNWGLGSGDASDQTWFIFLNLAQLNLIDLEPGDEVAVFDGTKIVGAEKLDASVIPGTYNVSITAFRKLGNFTDGYIPGNPVTIKMWHAATNTEVTVCDLNLLDPFGDAYTSYVFPVDDNQYSIAEISCTGCVFPPIVYAGEDETICPYYDFQTSPAVLNYTSVLWSSNGDGYFIPSPIILSPIYRHGPNDLLTGVELCVTATPIWPCSDEVTECMTLTFYSKKQIVSCPDDFDICIDHPAFMLEGATPEGGDYYLNGDKIQWFDPAVAGVGVHVITYVYVDVNNCEYECSFSITVNPLPVMTCPPDFTIPVNGGTITLTGAWPSGGDFSGPAVSGGMFDPGAAGVGAYIITYTYTDENGCTNTCTFTITVCSLPEVNCPDGYEFCISDPPYPLSEATPPGGIYSINGVPLIEFDPALAGAGSHEVTYTYTDYNGCTNFCTFPIIVKAESSVDIIPEVYYICQGDFMDFAGLVSAENYASLFWGTTDGMGDFVPQDVLESVYYPHEFDYIFGCISIFVIAEPENPCTLSAIDYMELCFYPLPEVDCPEDFTLHVTDPEIALSGATPAGGTYSGASVSMGNFNPGEAGIGDHTITYTYTDGNGCTNTCTFTITVILEEVICPGDFEICCNDEPVTLTGASPEGGVYSGNGVSINGTDYIFTPDCNATGDYVITYSIANAGSCTFTISVIALPHLDPLSDDIICEDDVPYCVPFNASNYGSINWSSSGNGTFADNCYWPDESDNENGSVVICVEIEAEPPCQVNNCGEPFTDLRNGKEYATVKIGEQCWMAENLNIGSRIDGNTAQSDNETIEKYCYGNLETNCDIYGGLYQWNEMMQYSEDEDNRGICPVGWHLPTDAEWCELESGIDPSINCGTSGFRGINGGGKLKATGTAYWKSPNSGATNASGFTGLPGGFLVDPSFNIFHNLTMQGYWWSSTQSAPDKAWNRRLFYILPSVGRSEYGKNSAFSVRCVKDKPESMSECMTLTIIKNPTIEMPDSDTICETDIYEIREDKFSASDYSSVFWESTSPGDGFFDEEEKLYTEYISGFEDIEQGSVTLCLTVYPINPCLLTVTQCMTLYIQKAPVVDAGPDQTVCEPDCVQLNATGENCCGLEWFTYGDGGFDNISHYDPVYCPGIMDIMQGYVIICLRCKGCPPCEDAVSCLTITILPFPEIDLPEEMELDCENYDFDNQKWLPIELDAIVTNADYVEWANNNGDGTFDNPNLPNTYYNIGTLDKWAQEVTLSLTAYCFSDAAAVKDIVLRIPTQLIRLEEPSWYGVSSFLDLSSNSITDMMAPVENDLIYMENELKAYYWLEPDPPLNTIGNWATAGYKAKFINATCLPLYGEPLTNHSFEIDANRMLCYLPVLTNVFSSVLTHFPVSTANDIFLVYDWHRANIHIPGLTVEDWSLVPGRAYLVLRKQLGNPVTVNFPDIDIDGGIGSDKSDGKESRYLTSPWGEIAKSPQPHFILFSQEAQKQLKPGITLGAFTNMNDCFGATEISKESNPTHLIVMGNDPFGDDKTGFDAGEEMRFSILDNETGELSDIEFVYDPSYPNTDNIFAPYGVSMVTDIKMLTTSIHQAPAENDLKIFPVPTGDYLNVVSGQTIRNVALINYLGQTVYSENANAPECRINVLGLTPGIYFLRIETVAGRTITRKVAIH
jgi:uncharacterized protein (TIGR02145 family)